ncbi:DUF1766-domain-containing protein [Amniculicola lignicola CBS 123094]|uniref:DUF1766-domain-containing protein n=1 Tax=Amniculicola lignicola CBS 123094 TaxID=1392246 RepID=A0A6A5WZ66_9PLEO|nr:DUF1766-domain-containing protein [Amniculicola lignicola CBS 123094]
MAFTGSTPESLLPRSDSKNPATTCKGITTNGRPCRRSISTAKQNNGVLAVSSVVSDSSDDETEVAAFFCWQHKDQAEQLAAANAAVPQRQDTRLYPLQERNSIDTLVARLGVLEVDGPAEQPRRKKREKRQDGRDSSRPNRRVNRPPTWDRVQGPLMAVPSDLMAQQTQTPHRPDRYRPPPKKKPSFWSSLCCGGSPDADDYVEAKPLNKVSNQQSSETSNLLSYIPKHLTPQTTSLLLTELSKPISPHDDEGYIYIFWLTDESAGPPPSSTASSLLVPPSRPAQGRRTSDVLRQYSVKAPQRPAYPRMKSGASGNSDTEKKTILLKIGRASNVHRRMTEWTRQCGYSLSLVRWYPYVPSNSPSPSPHTSPAHSRRQSYQNSPPGPARRVSEGVRKVPHAHRVERLIHLEIAEQRVKKNCEACGKEHREWFEVEATRDGVKGIDEVVKRWVDWAERAGNLD